MPRTAATGAYVAPSNSFNPAVSGTVINSTHFNSLLDDLETALSTTAATERAMWPTAGQVQDGAFMYGGSVAGTNTVTMSLTPTPTAYATGMRIVWKVAVTNTGATTVNVNSIGAKNVFRKVSSGVVALAGGELVANHIVTMVYDGTQFVLESGYEGTGYGTTAGTSTAYTLALVPTLPALINGARVTVKLHTAVGTTPTLAVDGLTAKTIVKAGAAAIVASDYAADTVLDLIYDSTLDRWVIEGPSPSGAAGPAYSIKTANYTAAAGDRILADCTNTAWTLTLPASPGNTDSPIQVKKVGSNALTIGLNSKNIRLSDGTVTASNPTIDGTPGVDFVFAYRGTDAGGQADVWNY